MSFRGKGDRRFNDYHYSWPKDWWYIDIDGDEVCRYCRETLLLYEITRDPEKVTSIIWQLAQDAKKPAVLLLVPDDGDTFIDATPVSWRWLGTRDWHEGTLGDWKAEVARIRREHDAQRHPRIVLSKPFRWADDDPNAEPEPEWIAAALREVDAGL